MKGAERGRGVWGARRLNVLNSNCEKSHRRSSPLSPLSSTRSISKGRGGVGGGVGGGLIGVVGAD